jgi:hypothetical protein
LEALAAARGTIQKATRPLAKRTFAACEMLTILPAALRNEHGEALLPDQKSLLPLREPNVAPGSPVGAVTSSAIRASTSANSLSRSTSRIRVSRSFSTVRRLVAQARQRIRSVAQRRCPGECGPARGCLPLRSWRDLASSLPGQRRADDVVPRPQRINWPYAAHRCERPRKSDTHTDRRLGISA